MSGNSEGASGTPDHYQVTVHVEESSLRGGIGRAGLPIESVRRIACDSDLIVMVEDKHGEPLSVGRKTRTVPAAIKRALWARDKGCRFPGCGRKRFVDAHHIEHWAKGGETSLANLLLLCDTHHRLVHEKGFAIAKDYRDRSFFRRPDGRAVAACGYRPEDVTDGGVTAGEYFDAHSSAEGSTMRHASEEEQTVRESAEVYWAADRRRPGRRWRSHRRSMHRCFDRGYRYGSTAPPCLSSHS